VSCPEDAPIWVKHAFGEISREPIGAHFEEVIRAWLELEKAYGFKLGSKALTTTNRPIEVKDWVRDGRGRSMAVRPIPDLPKFQAGWWKWWTALQLSWCGSWCGRRGEPLPPPEGGGWEKLVVPGQNGLLSVVATLYWWGYEEKKRGILSRSAGWEEAATDVVCVLQGLKDSSNIASVL
ncbi:hypothetical protein B0H13DRAFT_1600506, partial [Mycena leptocephala]